MKFRFLTLVLFCTPTLVLKAQWNNLNSPTNINLFSTWFANYDTGYAVGGNLNSSIFIKTTDGGASWNLITNTQTKWLYDVVFMNDTMGLACGYDGAIYKTNDAGLSWEAKPSGTTMALYAMSIKPDGTIFAVGQDGAMINSTNMGDNWNGLTSNTSQTMLDIQFYDNNYATAVGYNGEMIYTTNGGNNWAVRLMGTTQSITGVWMLSPDTIWMTSTGGRIYKTNNAGQSFYYLTPTTNDLNVVVFTDDVNGYIAGHQKLYQTSDGGASWNEMLPYPTLNGMKDMVVSADDRVMYAVGDNGAIIKNINTIGLDDVNQLGFLVYPNPAYDFLKLTIEGEYEFMLIDLTGKVHIHSSSLFLQNGMIDVSKLAGGLYNLVIRKAMEVNTVKVMVNRR